MGYTTDFFGEFKVTPTLLPKHKTYLEHFSQTRRMKRNSSIAESIPDPVREAVNLPIGNQGCFFVGITKDFGSVMDQSVTDYNQPPVGQPGLYCQWTPTEDGTGIIWDGNEKFYNYIEWLDYIITNFLRRWGYTLNGEIEWIGEDRDDRGLILVKDNVIEIKYGKIVYE